MRDQQAKGSLISTDAKIFAAIADKESASIKGAAIDCGVTQASATHSLWRMEKRLGVKLVERRVGLTESGLKALPYVRDMIAAEANLFNEFQGVKNVV